ncbi:MAG: hypothetical protein ABJK37_09345 [Paraglaciecola sp.]|uniref:hypothetical protein n=1 Tax=Paraglaciecola sp. TaxID=1920173 RepID=UPI00329768E3
MKLTLNKKKIKNLSKDASVLPSDMTPQVGGGWATAQTKCFDTRLCESWDCAPDPGATDVSCANCNSGATCIPTTPC